MPTTTHQVETQLDALDLHEDLVEDASELADEMPAPDSRTTPDAPEDQR
jgi:hypothetical protein